MQVEKSFRKLQMAYLSREDRARLHLLLGNSSNKYPLKREYYPKEVFPLFVTSIEYLQMVDGTLKKPFLPRNENGCLQESNSAIGGHGTDGMDLLAMLEEPDQADSFPNEMNNYVPYEQGDHELSRQTKRQGRVHMNYEVTSFL